MGGWVGGWGEVNWGTYMHIGITCGHRQYCDEGLGGAGTRSMGEQRGTSVTLPTIERNAEKGSEEDNG